MKANAKHFRVLPPQAHDTQTKLKVFRSSAIALNKIDNLDIPFNSPELFIFSEVTARHCLRIFVNSRVITCSCKLSLTNLWGYKTRLTIDARQNQVKVSNPCQLTAGRSFIAVYQRNLGQIKNILEGENVIRETRDKSDLPCIQKSDTTMRSYLCRGNGRHVWLFYDLASSIRDENVSNKVTKTEKAPRKTQTQCHRREQSQ